ncbi:hypothetical protein FQN49_005881 [Arthroderma sp. PD_2]|nr:hypothetical protein FQN49_005881 [Arthroderma sp. PD_2]
MCYRKYYRYKCCALEKDIDWVACEDKPPGLNCPKAHEHNWREPYAQYQGEVEGPCWNCMWASYNDGGKAKREFVESVGKPKPGDEPWESDEERKDQRMAGEDWYWIMRRRQRKQRAKERRVMEAEAAKTTESTLQTLLLITSETIEAGDELNTDIRSQRTSTSLTRLGLPGPIIAVPAILLVVYRAWSRNSLTRLGLVFAVITATIHCLHPSSVPFALSLVFFLGGTKVTKVKHDIKARLTISATGASGGEGPRTHIQVLANSGAASILILLDLYRIYYRDGHLPCLPYGGPEGLLMVGIVS